jgi:hypothetical protein
MSGLSFMMRFFFYQKKKIVKNYIWLIPFIGYAWLISRIFLHAWLQHSVLGIS